MRQITNITSESKQRFEIVLDDNSILELTLEYLDSQQGWVYSITRNNFTANQRKLVTGINILRTFKNYIPFGLTVSSTDDLDPAFLEDFENGRISLYVLNESDISFLDDNIYVR
ncbi:hypothetical protein KAR91_59440 [Candidatus Pacearchaeota archaeon]|nr:hypothetical protein [Candidatus Pacearchaeota archaeon]